MKRETSLDVAIIKRERLTRQMGRSCAAVLPYNWVPAVRHPKLFNPGEMCDREAGRAAPWL